MNILVLMAGSSEQFREAGYAYPKSLVEIDGVPVIERVVNDLASLHTPDNDFIFVIRKDENVRFHIGDILHLLLPASRVVEANTDTGGAACSALLAIEQIDNEQALFIVNGDQIIDADLAEALAGFRLAGLDGGVIVFQAVHPRWSYVKCNDDGYVIEAAEKRPISHFATAGAYYFAHGADFVAAAMTMIRKDAHVDGNFYICPAFNEMILEQKKIGVHLIPATAYFSLMTPQLLQRYEDHLLRRTEVLP